MLFSLFFYAAYRHNSHCYHLMLRAVTLPRHHEWHHNTRCTYAIHAAADFLMLRAPQLCRLLDIFYAMTLICT